MYPLFPHFFLFSHPPYNREKSLDKIQSDNLRHASARRKGSSRFFEFNGVFANMVSKIIVCKVSDMECEELEKKLNEEMKRYCVKDELCWKWVVETVESPFDSEYTKNICEACPQCAEVEEDEDIFACVQCGIVKGGYWKIHRQKTY